MLKKCESVPEKNTDACLCTSLRDINVLTECERIW